jgi:cell division protein FtsB
MKVLRNIITVLRNKYVLALLVFVFFLLFFDQNSIFVQMDRQRQLNVLKGKEKFYEDEIAKTQKELSGLQNDPAAIEKYARENFYMKKPNEDLFIVVNPGDSAK